MTGGPDMAVPERGAAKRKTSKKKDWTYTLERAKTYIYLIEMVVFILVIVNSVLGDLDELKESYFNLPDVIVPICIMVALIGVEEVAFSALIGAFRKDLPDRFRHLESAKRAAMGTLVASFVIAAIVLAPPFQDMIENTSGDTYEKTDSSLFRSFKTKDALNLTGVVHVSVRTTGSAPFNLTLERVEGDDEVLVEERTSVTSWELDLDLDLVEDYVVTADPLVSPPDPTWVMELETELRPSVIKGVAVPFLVLGILNAVWYPVARYWSGRTETDYVDTQTRKLRARFKVEEAFLIYEDGRLIAHNSRRLKPERDKDIMTGMLTAVQSFVTDTLVDEERGTLDQLKYGNLSILIEPRGRINLATIISGDASPVLRQGMKNIVGYVNGQYRQWLDDWDGDIDRFKDVKRYIGHLVSTGREEPVYPDELFLLHRDGRLIAHQNSRLEPSIDDGLLQNWVEEITDKVSRAMEDPTQAMPPKLNVMGYDVLMEYTNYLHMGYVTTRRDTEPARELMVDTIQDIDARFHDILYEWDGATQELTDVKTMMEVVFPRKEA